MKEILLTPGPTHIPTQVFQAMQQPTLHHRTDTFKKHFVAARAGIRGLTRSSTDPIFLAGSGTAAMEAALVNTTVRGEEILVINAGKFGERWVKIGERLGLKCNQLTAAVGDCPPLDAIEEAIKSNPRIKAVCMQYCETSTTAQLPVPQICSSIKNINPAILTIVDAVSAIGTLPIYVDDLKIDILATATHKGLMLPPGLALIILSERAWKVAENNQTASLYFNLLAERKASANDTTAWTPAMNHIVALNAALSMVNAEGEEKVYARHDLMGRVARAALQAMGLKLMAEQYASPAVTGAYMPNGIDAEAIRKEIFQNFSVRMAGGQDELKGIVIRIGHMGYCSQSDLLAGIAALEITLYKRGALKEPSKGVDAALKVFT